MERRRPFQLLKNTKGAKFFTSLRLPALAIETVHTNSQRQSVQRVGRRCCAAGYDGRAAARPYRLE
jgi:hypothetical protein